MGDDGNDQDRVLHCLQWGKLTLSCCVDLDNVVMAGLDLLHCAAMVDCRETKNGGQSDIKILTWSHIFISISLALFNSVTNHCYYL